MGKLVLHLPDGSTRDIPLVRERTTIGRRADNDICLPLPTVSGAHAAVVTVLDDSFLEDLGSHNGTLVNGKGIRKHFLRDHDEIDIGDQRLVYVSGEFEGIDTGRPVATRDEPVVVPPVRKRGRAPPPGRPAVPGAVPAAPGPPEGGSPGGPDNAMIDTSLLFAPSEKGVDRAGALRAEARALEVLDGPRVGTIVAVDMDEFVLGRLGLQLAAVRRTADGFRLVALEGEAPELNGARVPVEGAPLTLGDVIAVAGTRVRYRAAEGRAGA